ncbi:MULTISPECIES: S8 family serine peptidase [unclassified Exiguobacterium]|uniref:S8 family peptidase n=1 Tax=unclassified Exiguobacterium TaxID=2644629 RepID=UPI001BE920DC|nr:MULTISPECIES: S8 family serine peptidase [unclassified Exiguobacterium]
MKKIALLTAVALLLPTTVGAAKPVILEKHGYVVSEPRISSQYYVHQIGTDLAWSKTRGASDIVVALIDSSADRNHMDLKNVPRVVNSMKGPYSADIHGTHTAGILAGKHNQFGIAGLAPNVRYHFYNVFYGKNSKYTDSWTVAKAVDTAVAKGANLINLSLGGDDYDSRLATSIKRARAKGVIIVASSGNDGQRKSTFPANMKEVIAVGAIDSRHRIADFSNMDANVKIVAPGVNVLSLGVNNRFVYMDGTSMAAPMVTASLALVKSINPYLTPGEIEALIAKMPRVSGTTHTELNTMKLLEATSRPIYISTPSVWKSRYVKDVKLSVMNHSNLKSSFTLYQGSKKIKTFSPNRTFTMYSSGDWLPSGQYRIVGQVTDGKYKRYTSRTIDYVNTLKTSVSVEATDEKTFTLRTSRKGMVTVLDLDGNVLYEALHIAGTFPVRGDTTRGLTVILKPTDVREKVVTTTYDAPEIEKEQPVVETL